MRQQKHIDSRLVVCRTPTPSPKIKTTCGGGDAGAGSVRLDDAGPETASSSSIQLFLCYLSSLFLALRSGGTKPGKEELPFWPGDASSLGMPQALQLPKRTLQLNVLDSYDTLRLATRLLLVTVGQGRRAVWEAPSMLELSVCAHVGLFSTLRRKDLSERTLKFIIVAIFQIGTALLTLEDVGISSGWPVRLIEALVQRAEAEAHLLVPHCKLIVEAVRSFIEASIHLEAPELWRSIFQLLLRCVPTSQRALWPGARDKEVESLQLYVWQNGLVYILAHPELKDSREAEGSPNDADANSFWGWALTEITTLAQEMAGQRGTGSIRLLLYAYRTILQSICQPNAEDASPRPEVANGEESPSVEVSFTGTGDELTPDRAAKGAAWSRVAIAMLNFVGPAIGRPMDEPDLLVLPLLKQSLLHARVPSLLAAGPHGPFWARSVLEKLVSVLTGPITSQTPLKVVREAVSLVSKFFLQNLQTLQRHDCFGQLWSGGPKAADLQNPGARSRSKAMARADPYSELRTSAEEQETDDELRKLMQPSQLLDIEAFSGEPQVQLIPSQALMSLVLYLFFFVAFPLVMVLIKLDWIKEPPGTQGLGILNKALAFLNMHHGFGGSLGPMIQTINAVIFTLCGKHAPASAVFYPLAMTLSRKCEYIAFAACAPKNIQGFFQLKASRMIHLLVREHESLQVQLQGEKLPDVITSPAVLEHVDNLEEVQFTLCGCCRDPTIKHLGDVYAILLFNMNFSFAWTSRVANRFLKLAHSAWPMFSPFWMQQLRVRSLKSFAISAKGLSLDSAMFLNSYARACESGSIPAEELADQILLGFPLPKSFAQIV
eukprot:symbB.v1.2.019869.t2/scaffold1647.1/size107771/5